MFACPASVDLFEISVRILPMTTECPCARLQAADRAQLVVLLPVVTLGSLTNLYRAAMVVMMAGANFVAVRMRPCPHDFHINNTTLTPHTTSLMDCFSLFLLVTGSFLSTCVHMSLISSTAHTCPTTAPIQPIDCCVLTPADPSDGPHPPTGGTPFECGLALLRAMRDYRSLTGFLVGIKVPECRTAHDALLWLSLVVRVAGAEWTTPALIRLSGEDLLHELQRVLSSRDEDYAPDRRH